MITKVVKNVSIAHSGVYTYGLEELPSLGLSKDSIPAAFLGEQHFNVYRPATVLERAAPLFTRLPITVEHPDRRVLPENAKDLAEGLTGDSACVKYHDGEAYIESTLTLLTQDAINYYNNGVKEVSPGYDVKTKWLDNVIHYKGMPVHIVVTDIPGVNHLALTVAGRGGPTACVHDNRGGTMKLKSGLFRWAQRKAGGTKDTDVSTALQKLTSGKLSEAEINQHVDLVVDAMKTLPDSESKQVLDKCLDDLRFIGQLDAVTAEAAVNKTISLYQSLDSAASKELEDTKVEPVEDTEVEPEDKKPVVEDYSPGTTGQAGAGAQAIKGDDKPTLDSLKEAAAAMGFDLVAKQPVTDTQPAAPQRMQAVVTDTKTTSKGIDDFMSDLRR